MKGIILERNFSQTLERCVGCQDIRMFSESIPVVVSLDMVGAVSNSCWVWRRKEPMLLHFFCFHYKKLFLFEHKSFSQFQFFSFNISFLEMGISTSLILPNHKPPSFFLPHSMPTCIFCVFWHI